jgi:predicted MFS family arabinose efflux permease
MSGTIIGGFTGRVVAGLMAADVNWQAAFIALATLNAAVAIALAIWLPREERHTSRHMAAGDAGHRGSFAAHFRNTRLATTYVVGFSVLFTQVAMFTYVTFYLAAPPFNLSTVALGWLFVVYLLGAAVTPISGHWIDRHGHRTGIGSAMAIGGAGALLTLVPWLPAIVFGLALAATGVFIAQATASSYIGAVTTKDRGLAVGLYSTFYYAGGSAGSALPSAVWSLWGWPGCVALVVAVQSAGAAVAFTQWTTTTDSRLPTLD